MFRFKLVSLSGLKFDDDVNEVILPTLDGQIGVLTGHMPLLSVATNGAIKVRHQAADRDDMLDYYAVSGGVIEVKDNILSVLVDDADSADEINEQEAQQAFERAQTLLAEAKDQISLERAQSLVDRQAIRLQVAGLRRRRK